MEQLETMLSPDSVSFRNQLAHQTCTRVNLTDKNIELDFKEADSLPGSLKKNQLTLKVKSQNALNFSSGQIKNLDHRHLKKLKNIFYTPLCLKEYRQTAGRI